MFRVGLLGTLGSDSLPFTRTVLLDALAEDLGRRNMKGFDDLIGNNLMHLNTLLDLNLSLRARDLFVPSGGGWQTGDVTVTWSCTDALSGVAAAKSRASHACFRRSAVTQPDGHSPYASICGSTAP